MTFEEDDLIRRAAKEAVKETFARLGVDVDNPAELEEFRRDIRFGGVVRRAADKGVAAFVWITIAGLVAVLVAGAKMKLGGLG